MTLRWSAPATTSLPLTTYVADVGTTNGLADLTSFVEAGSAPGLRDLARFATGSAAPMVVAHGVPRGRYHVRIRATNAAGTSGPSAEIIVIVE